MSKGTVPFTLDCTATSVLSSQPFSTAPPRPAQSKPKGLLESSKIPRHFESDSPSKLGAELTKLNTKLMQTFLAVLDEMLTNPTVGGLDAAGQLHSTIGDLAKWVSFQFCADGGPRQGPVPPGAPALLGERDLELLAQRLGPGPLAALLIFLVAAVLAAVAKRRLDEDQAVRVREGRAERAV